MNTDLIEDEEYGLDRLLQDIDPPDTLVHRIEVNGLQSLSAVLTEQEDIKKLVRFATEELEKREKEGIGHPDPAKTSFSDRVTHHLCNNEQNDFTKFVQVQMKEEIIQTDLSMINNDHVLPTPLPLQDNPNRILDIMAPGQPATNSTQYLPYPFSEQARAPLLTDGPTNELNTSEIEDVLRLALQAP